MLSRGATGYNAPVDDFKQFVGHKYLNLETYRRNGAGVRTPVWFAGDEDELYLYTLSDSGKVKRILNNPRVRLAPSDYQGNPLGEWVEGEARILAHEEAGAADRLLSRKYLLKRLFDWTRRLRRTSRTYLGVRPLAS